MPPAAHHPLVDWSQNRRTVILALLYAVVIAASFYLAYEIRFEFIVPDSYQQERLRIIAIVVGVKLVALVVAPWRSAEPTPVPAFSRNTLFATSVVPALPTIWSPPACVPARWRWLPSGRRS